MYRFFSKLPFRLLRVPDAANDRSEYQYNYLQTREYISIFFMWYSEIKISLLIIFTHLQLVPIFIYFLYEFISGITWRRYHNSRYPSLSPRLFLVFFSSQSDQRGSLHHGRIEGVTNWWVSISIKGWIDGSSTTRDNFFYIRNYLRSTSTPYKKITRASSN